MHRTRVLKSWLGIGHINTRVTCIEPEFYRVGCMVLGQKINIKIGGKEPELA